MILDHVASQSKQEEPEDDPRLEQIKRIARESKEGLAGDFTNALARFRDRLANEHPDLALFLVRESFERATWAEMRRLDWGASGVQMQANAKAERETYPDAPLDEATKKVRLERKRAGQAAFAKQSLLWSYMIDGRALSWCSRADLMTKAAANEIDTRFLRAIAGMVPDDQSKVKDHVTDKQAADAMRKAKSAA